MGNKTTISIEGNKIASLYEFLSSLKLSGRASRGRTKIMNALESKINEMNSELKEIEKKHIELKEDGTPKYHTEDDPENGIIAGQMIYRGEGHQEAYIKEVNEVTNDKYDMNLVEHLRLINHLKEALDDYDENLETHEAYLYDVILDELEKMDLGKFEEE